MEAGGVSDGDTARYYLLDLGDLLRKEALDAKREYEEAKRSTDEGEKAYRGGYLMAFYHVISLMQDQALGFGIDLKEMKLESIDPERDLL